MDDRRSERFGRYEILTELGRGAMGIVYKARDPKINRVVAVKTVSLEGQPPEEEREYRERFFREAEAAGRLSHPGIVTIFDVGEEPETRAPYIVMELVGGQSLDKVLARDDDHKLPLETALQLGLELAEALDCAQSQGVIHRDLKPANILITSVVTSPRPIVKKLPKPLHANGTRPPPEKVAGASSPTVSPTLSPAMLEIEVDHKFAEAHLSIWVDDTQAAGGS